MLVRTVQAVVVAVTVAVGAIALSTEPAPDDVLTIAGDASALMVAEPTTAPVGIPLRPTPTPFGIPQPVSPPALAVAPVESGTGSETFSGDAAPAPSPGPDSAETDDVAGDGGQGADRAGEVAADGGSEAAVPQTVEPTPSPVPTTTPTAEPTPMAEPTSTAEPTPTAAPRIVSDVGYQPLGQAGGIQLYLPVGRVELIGFHEAGHPGSQAINAAGTGVTMMTLESRGRGTPARSAADIVVPPGEPVVAPVTGTVVAASSYILYCQYDDRLVYIEPDGMPGWQVRLFHVEGDAPPVGARVIAGQTVVASSARTLPFESQVDEHTGEPSWPHVHIEVVDTSVPDTRPPGPGCP